MVLVREALDLMERLSAGCSAKHYPLVRRRTHLTNGQGPQTGDVLISQGLICASEIPRSETRHIPPAPAPTLWKGPSETTEGDYVAEVPSCLCPSRIPFARTQNMPQEPKI
jgi:hypothetical protein